MMTRNLLLLSLLLAIAYLLYSQRPSGKRPADGYRVVSYDATTGQWVFIRTATIDDKRMESKITTVCSSYKWGNHDLVTGPTACNLPIGRLLVTNIAPKSPNDFLDVWIMSSDTLCITEGSGDDRVAQQFRVLKNEVL